MDSQINKKNTPIHPEKRDSSGSSDSEERYRRKLEPTVESEAQKLGLPLIPCAYCDFKHYITFDLGNHLYEKHRQE